MVALQSKSHLWRPRPRRGAAAVAQPASSPPQETAGEDSEDVGRRRKRQWRWRRRACLPHRWSEGCCDSRVGWLGSAGGRDSRFPTRRRRNSQHSPPPAGRPPGSLVRAWPQGSRVRGPTMEWQSQPLDLSCQPTIGKQQPMMASPTLSSSSLSSSASPQLHSPPLSESESDSDSSLNAGSRTKLFMAK